MSSLGGGHGGIGEAVVQRLTSVGLMAEGHRNLQAQILEEVRRFGPDELASALVCDPSRRDEALSQEALARLDRLLDRADDYYAMHAESEFGACLAIATAAVREIHGAPLSRTQRRELARLNDHPQLQRTMSRSAHDQFAVVVARLLFESVVPVAGPSDLSESLDGRAPAFAH